MNSASSVSHRQIKVEGVGQPGCTTCGGLGYISYSVPIEDPRFGKVVHCPACGDRVVREVRQRAYESKRERIQRYSSILAGKTFATFDAHAVDITIRRAYHVALQYAEEPRGWLVLYGPRGTGKSHLANAVANQVQARGWIVIGATVPDLLDMLKSGFEGGDYMELLQLATEADLLVLDDLGTEKETDWSYEKLFQIINYRYNQEKPTVFSFNGTLHDREERIASRMADTRLSKQLHMIGQDYRERSR